MAQLRERLSERDLAIIRQVAELRLMSARQIQALHFPGAAHHSEQAATRARQRVVARLLGERLLTCLERRIGGVRAGSVGFVLALGPVGQRVLAIDGPRRRSHEPGLRFFDHTLATAQLAVDLSLAARAGMVELLSFQAEPDCWREFAGVGGSRRVLRPDAFVSLGVGEYELRWFIEVDRSSESLPVVVRKCRLYADYYQSGQEQARSGVFPRVCWIVPDTARAERLRAAIARDSRLPPRLFVVTIGTQAVAVLSNTNSKRLSDG
ncbi:MAG TPA: replication-relaxation family protein [Solirubrobacteraceae bacterium]|nr:replication-relaxation family protein [Solirubrobacteraceae bacterium]